MTWRRLCHKATRILNAGHNIQKAIQAAGSALETGAVVLVKGRTGQRLERVSLALQGRQVCCTRRECDMGILECADCPALARASAALPSTL